MVLSKALVTDPRVVREAKSLRQAGHQVTVHFWDRHGDYPPEQVVEGVRAMAVKNTGLMRLAGSDLLRNPLWWRRAAARVAAERPDVVHCHDLDTLYAGVLAKERTGCKLVYDSHEIFGMMIEKDMPRVVVRRAFAMEKKWLRRCDAVITVNDPVRDHIKGAGATCPVEIVANCKDLMGPYREPNNMMFTLLYIGLLHKSRMFPECVDLIGHMEGVHFVIAGKKENVYDEVRRRARRYPNVEFVGSVPYSRVLPMTLEADAVLGMVDPSDPNNRIAWMNKQFESMVCGRPILCSEETASGEMTERLGVGITRPFSPDGMRDGIAALRDDRALRLRLGKKALEWAEKEYHWPKQERKLVALYESLARR